MRAQRVVRHLTVCTAMWLGLLTAQTARAHDVMGTVFYVDLGRSHVHLDVETPIDELRSALGEPSQPGVAALPGSRDALVAYLLAHLAIASPSGVSFALEGRAREVTLHDARNWLRIEIDATPPAEAVARTHAARRPSAATQDAME